MDDVTERGSVFNVDHDVIKREIHIDYSFKDVDADIVDSHIEYIANFVRTQLMEHKNDG